MSAPGLLFLVTEDWYFVSHRLELARRALAAGYRVAVATRVDAHRETIEAAGIELFPIPFERSGKNPWQESAVVHDIVRAYRAFRPDIVHHVALKPVLYGTFAARRAGVRTVVNAIAGLGYAFSSTDVRARMLRRGLERAYAWALGSGAAILQNGDDLEFLVRRRIVDREHCALIPGSGVDLGVFAHAPEPEGQPLVVLPARMLRDKGVEEFAEAARIVRSRGIAARFALVGTPDPQNPASIPEARLRAWAAEGAVEWWGWRPDMANVHRAASIVCLPSYREGLPKSLIEAAASGRAIVTCDVPGCRDAIVQGETGLLVPARDAAFLADALRALLVNPERRKAMGAAGRTLAERRFSIDSIAAQTLALYARQLASAPGPNSIVRPAAGQG